jgi:hypothetical protein
VVPWNPPPPRCRRASHFFHSTTARQAPVQYEPAAEPGAQGVGRSVKQAERQPHQRAHRGLLIRKANYAIEAADSTFMPALRKLLKRA